jgi:hypothetical protein
MNLNRRIAGHAALLLGLVATIPAIAAPRPQPAHAVVPFIADDLPRALAEAKERNLPIFVESWAPW